MAMTVSELRKALKGIPGHLEVYRADHDHGTFETAGDINHVIVINKKDMTEYENDRGDWNGDTTFQGTPNKYLLLRP